jgi:ATP-dependent Clp protease protease subunit
MNGTKNLTTTNKDKDEFVFGGVQERIEMEFLKNKIHFLTGSIDEDGIKKAIQWIVYENTCSEQTGELTLYINSVGGDLYESFALVDIMKNSTIPIRTIGIGSIMSAAFLVFASGTKGRRFIGKNTGIMCHQHSGEIEGKHHDIVSYTKENQYCNERMLDIIQIASGLESRVIKSKLLNSTDIWLKSEEMVTLGLADHILG